MPHGLTACVARPAVPLPLRQRGVRMEVPALRLTPRDDETPREEAPAARTPPPGVTDLVRLAAEGDGEAWRRLVGAYSGRVFGLLHRQCNDRDLAEEVTQVTFVKLVTHLRQSGPAGAGYDERGRFESWLFRIATNALRDELRRRKRQARPTDMSPGATSGRDEAAQAWAGVQGEGIVRGPQAGEDPAEAADRAEQVDRLRGAVAQLPDADREVLYLRHTAGLSFAEIAETLGAPLGTVLARAHRALGKLRKLLPELADDSRSET